MRLASSAPPAASASPRPPRNENRGHPLLVPAFRAIWLAALFSNLGTWVQDVAESWTMLSLTKDPLPVAGLSTAVMLPMFALLVPAGVLADRFDRRVLLIIAQSWMTVVTLLLAIATWAHVTTPFLLLASSAGLGIGNALTGPAWQSLVPELVPREQTADAVMFNSIGFNLARATGPAVGGLILSAAGPACAFFLNALSFLAVLAILRGYPAIKTASEAPRTRRREPLWRALVAAFRYVQKSKSVATMCLSVGLFGLFASMVLPLVSVFARGELHSDPRGYGILVGSFGTGAVLGAFTLKRVRAMAPPRALIAMAMALYGAGALAFSGAHSLLPAAGFLFCAGLGWIPTFATLNALVQLSAAPWIKSRALAIYQMSFNLAWAIGAAAGGVLAGSLGTRGAMMIGAVGSIFAGALTSQLRAIPSYEGDPRAQEILETPMPVSVR